MEPIARFAAPSQSARRVGSGGRDGRVLVASGRSNDRAIRRCGFVDDTRAGGHVRLTASRMKVSRVGSAHASWRSGASRGWRCQPPRLS